jgi:hypothetical protein
MLVFMRVHEGGGVQGVDGYARAFELSCRINRKEDLRQLALAVGPPSAELLPQHDIVKIDFLLSRQGDVDDARRRACHQQQQQLAR